MAKGAPFCLGTGKHGLQASKGACMGRNQYSFKKRQKEIERKKKQEEKRQRRMNKDGEESKEE
jgi:hypothetical protein